MDLQELPKPIRELALLGDTDEANWPNYHELGVTKKHIPVLVDIIRHTMDFFTPVESLVTPGEDEPQLGPETWLPMHAWRALGQLQAVEALPDLLNLLPLIDSEDMDIIQEDLPEVLALLGPPVIPQLGVYLADSKNNIWARLVTSDALTRIAQAHAEVRPQVLDVLLSVLQGYAAEDYGFNGFLISNLADLKAVEAAPLVEEAYRANRVDGMVLGDWEDFQVAVGLLDRRTTPSNFNLTSAYPSGMFGSAGHTAKEDKKTKKKRKMEKEGRKKSRKGKKR